MSSAELVASGWIDQAIRALLGFSLATLLVAVLRWPCRRVFGPEMGIHLWWLVPSLLLATELPRSRNVTIAVLPGHAAGAFPGQAVMPLVSGGNLPDPWPLWALLAWLAGFLVSAALAIRAQRTYRSRLRHAEKVTVIDGRWPVLRAGDPATGPALVGAWRPRIVLPLDFEIRYSPLEQRLVLAHETEHARRRDGCSSLIAQALRAMFWFHPMAWWAREAFRQDQELACDAAVMARLGRHRRSYAAALLKTQASVAALPVGCPWSPRHPLKERVAMLKSRLPGTARRWTGRFVLAVVLAGAFGTLYAANPASSVSAMASTAVAQADRFTLKIDIATLGHPPSLHFTQCLLKGRPSALSGRDGLVFSWNGRFTVLPAAGGEIEIRSDIHTRWQDVQGKVQEMAGRPIVRTPTGRTATIVFGQKKEAPLENGSVRFDLTPHAGCDAMAPVATAEPASLSRLVRNQPARSVASALAREGGFTLLNPEALSSRPVSFKFEEVSLVSALQLVADIDGKRAIFDGRTVRFEPK